jgi:hypothetical protein
MDKNWFKDLFINEAKKALARHSGTGGESMPSTIILEDNYGVQVAAMLTNEKVRLTANKDVDIRDGTTAITSEGLVTGNKEIPAYHVTEGTKVIPNNGECKIGIPNYKYTRLQAIVCSFNTNLSNSVAAEKVVINGKLYPVSSTEVDNIVDIDDETKSIDLGIINTSGKPYLIRYFSYKEIY